MLQGTTPIYELRIGGCDLTEKSVYVTIVSNCRTVITKTGDDLEIEFDGENSTVYFSLTQEETLSLDVGNAYIQARFIGADGLSYGTESVPVKVTGALLKKVITYVQH